MAGRISEYIFAGKLNGTELMDISVPDGGAPSGYVTRKVLINSFNGEFPSIYSGNDVINSPRTVDQDGNVLNFNNGDFNIDSGNFGIVYDFLTKRVGIGEGTPLASVHIKGQSGDDLFFVENSIGSDAFLIDSVGNQTIRATAGVQQITYQTTGGNKSILKNNSNQFEFSSVGVATVHGGNGTGSGIMVNGYLSAAQTYTSDNRRMQGVANTNSLTEIVYFDFNSDSGTQSAKFGLSDAEEQRFDTWDVYSELSTYHGDFTISGTTVNMANLPTSSAGLSAGDLWNNAGVINIV